MLISDLDSSVEDKEGDDASLGGSVPHDVKSTDKPKQGRSLFPGNIEMLLEKV
jgi:hypothetical protein